MRVALLLHRVIMLVPGLFELALDVLNFLIGLLKLDRYSGFFAFKRFELLAESRRSLNSA